MHGFERHVTRWMATEERRRRKGLLECEIDGICKGHAVGQRADCVPVSSRSTDLPDE